jgi:hypothetical protein
LDDFGVVLQCLEACTASRIFEQAFWTDGSLYIFAFYALFNSPLVLGGKFAFHDYTLLTVSFISFASWPSSLTCQEAGEKDPYHPTGCPILLS